MRAGVGTCHAGTAHEALRLAAGCTAARAPHEARPQRRPRTCRGEKGRQHAAITPAHEMHPSRSCQLSRSRAWRYRPLPPARARPDRPKRLPAAVEQGNGKVRLPERRLAPFRASPATTAPRAANQSFRTSVGSAASEPVSSAGAGASRPLPVASCVRLRVRLSDFSLRGGRGETAERTERVSLRAGNGRARRDQRT